MRKLRLTKPVITFRDPLLASPFARWSAAAATALNLGAWVAILGIPNLPGSDAVVVHYTTTFGIDALGSWKALFRLPLTGTVLLAANLALARLFTKSEVGIQSSDPQSHLLPPASAILLVASVVLQFAVLLGSVLLWRVNR